jgi:hypothetical protein
MKNEKWPPEKISALMSLADKRLSRREIAKRMDVSVKSVTAKLLAARVYLPLNAENHAAGNHTALLAARFPRFEDVTRGEAKEISRGAPRSGVPCADRGYSLIGNAADLCAS